MRDESWVGAAETEGAVGGRDAAIKGGAVVVGFVSGVVGSGVVGVGKSGG